MGAERQVERPCLNSIKFPLDNASRRDSWAQLQQRMIPTTSFLSRQSRFPFFSIWEEEEASEN
jgi:hypothetical protein